MVATVDDDARLPSPEMCVAFIALSDRSPVKLLVAFNRDEDYARPTRAARVWDDGELELANGHHDDDCDGDGGATSRSVRIVGCRDEKCGGTWLALCASTGKWALLTNACGVGQTGASSSGGGGGGGGARSRGALVTNYLKDPTTSGEKYAAMVFEERFTYDGFNLIVGDARTTHAHWVGNRGEANARTPLRLEPGRVYGLANEVLDSPWPKVTRGKAKMESIMREFSKYDVDELPALALEERVLREVLHAPLDAAARRPRRPATPPREETSRDPTVTVRFEHSIARASSDDLHDEFEVDVDEDDEETVELVVEQVEAHESECSFVRPGELPGRPNCGTRTSQVIIISTDGRCRWREHHFHPSTFNRGHRRPSVSASTSGSASASAGSRSAASLPDVVLTEPAVVHAFRVPTRARESTPIA